MVLRKGLATGTTTADSVGQASSILAKPMSSGLRARQVLD